MSHIAARYPVFQSSFFRCQVNLVNLLEDSYAVPPQRSSLWSLLVDKCWRTDLFQLSYAAKNKHSNNVPDWRVMVRNQNDSKCSLAFFTTHNTSNFSVCSSKRMLICLQFSRVFSNQDLFQQKYKSDIKSSEPCKVLASSQRHFSGKCCIAIGLEVFQSFWQIWKGS